MWNILKRDLRKNWLYQAGLVLILFACMVTMSIFSFSAVQAVEQNKSDDLINYQHAYGDFSIGSKENPKVPDNLFEFLNALTYNGEPISYGLWKTCSMWSRMETLKPGEVKEGVVIDLQSAKHLRMNNTNGVWFSESYPNGYREIIVTYRLKDKFLKGEMYETEYGIVKVIGYIQNDYGLTLNITNKVSENSNQFVLCAEPLITAYEGRVSASVILFSNLDADFYYSVFGRQLRYVPYNTVYGPQSESFRDATFIVILINCILMLSIATNIVITKRRSAKLNAVFIMCGATHKQIVMAEFLKTVFIFFLPFIITLFIIPLLNGMTDITYVLVCSLIIFISYGLTQGIKVYRVIKEKHLQVLRGAQ